MDFGPILLLSALILGVGLFLAAPLLGKPMQGLAPGISDSSALMAERDRVINALQELDFDFKLGKIPDEDYPVQRAELLQKGAEILRKLDTVAPTGSRAKAGASDAVDRLERAAAARRADSATDSRRVSDDEIEEMLAARRAARKGNFAGFCPRCGKPVSIADRFCPSCGKPLK
jgi:RNA polymerase-binding transcription factor DksA